MPWKEQKLMDQRREFALRALMERTSFTALCQEYGISPKTGYKWKERFLEQGLEGLCDRSRRPHSSPNELSESVVCRIVQLRLAHPTWGAPKLRAVYARRHPGQELPSESSFKRVLDRAGLVQRRKRRPATHSGHLRNHVPVEKPNDLWTVDFKGWWYTPEKQRCEPLTVRDAYSRYVLCASVPANARTETIHAEFERIFGLYGMPQAIRSDNGRPFAVSTAPLGLSRLSAWWVALGIDLDRIDPGRPYQNGGHERMHLDIALEVEGRIHGDLAAQAAALRTWRQTFNHERPHAALGMRCPAQVYQRSPRRFSGTPDLLDYPVDFLSRTVVAAGHIKLHGTRIQISSALCGWNVGLKPTPAGKYTVHFGRLCLGWIDPETEAFHHDPPKEPRHREEN